MEKKQKPKPSRSPFKDLKAEIRKLALDRGKIRKFNLPDEAFSTHDEEERFLNLLTSEIWEYKQEIDAESLADLWDYALKQNELKLQRIERYLDDGTFSKMALQSALDILKKDLDNKLERARKSKDVTSEFGFEPGKWDWKRHVGKRLVKIFSIYKAHSPLKSDYQISHNLAGIFKGLRLLPDKADTIRRAVRTARK